jgi:hypothetical protein
MKLPEDVDGWRELIAKLESSLVTLQDEESDCRLERSKLSLGVALHDTAALRAAEQLELKGCKLALEVSNAREALGQARQGLAKAEQQAAEAAEGERQRQVRAVRQQRREAAEGVDASMKELIERALSLMDSLDALAALGEPSHGKKLTGQLRRAWCWHLADCGVNKSAQGWKPAILQGFLGDERETAASWRCLADALGEA